MVEASLLAAGMEVVLLASSRGTQNGPDWSDVAGMVKAFESQNRVVVEICLLAGGTEELPDLIAEGRGYTSATADVERALLASVKCRWRAERFKSLEGLLTFLLYQLDFALASYEMEGISRRREPPPA